METGKRNQQWYLGETFNAAIGQGYVAVTPMQMAQLMSAVANGGFIYSPTIIKLETLPSPAGKADIKPETLELVKAAFMVLLMKQAVQEAHPGQKLLLSAEKQEQHRL